MKKSIAEEYILHFFTQITEGCDSVECTEVSCRSHPSFCIRYKDNNEAAFQAIQMALNEPFDHHLCPGVPFIRMDKTLMAPLMAADHDIKTMIATENFSKDKFKHHMKTIMNQNLFPYFLLSNQNKLSKQNIAIDDDLQEQFVRTIQRFPFFDYESFIGMVNRILKDDCKDTYHHIRALILILTFEPLYSPQHFNDLLIKVLAHILDLNQNCETRKIFFQTLATLPKCLKLILESCQTAMVVKAMEVGDDFFKYIYHFSKIAKFFHFIRKYADINSDEISNETITECLSKTYKDEDFLDFQPFYPLLTLEFKNNLFHLIQLKKQEDQQSRLIMEQIRERGPFFFLNSQDRVLREVCLNISVRRSHLIEDTINAVESFSEKELSRKLMVTFKGEEGIDAGGVSREFFTLLTDEIFSPKYGMFVQTKDNYYWFNKVDLGIIPLYYKTIGTIVALSIYNNVLLSIRFPRLLYKKLLNYGPKQQQYTLEDLAELEPEVANSLRSIQKMKDDGQDVSDLDMNMTISIDRLGESVDIPLTKNGENIPVTNNNVELFIHLCIQYYLVTSIEEKFKAFAEGFSKLFHGPTLQMFFPDELDILVSGEEIFDWEALQKNAQYSKGYSSTSKEIKWFWEIFFSFTTDMKRKFLQFTTGSDRAPAGGLKNIHLHIQRLDYSSKLPTAHTCFSLLHLPKYHSKREMEQKLIKALTMTEGFGLK